MAIDCGRSKLLIENYVFTGDCFALAWIFCITAWHKTDLAIFSVLPCVTSRALCVTDKYLLKMSPNKLRPPQHLNKGFLWHSLMPLTTFFLSWFPFTGMDNSQDSRGRERTIFYSPLPVSPPAHKHSEIYLQLYTWDDYDITLAFTRLLLGEIYHHLIKSLFWLIDDFCFFTCWFDFRFCYSYLTWETGRLELASTIILILQANWLAKCASHLRR